jgi:hypothetical protein
MIVPINVATVQHFKARDGREILAQVYLVEPELAAAKAGVTSEKRTYLLLSEIQALTDQNGVGALYSHLVNKVSGILSIFANSRNLGFRPPHRNGNYRILFDVNPRESSVERRLKCRLNGSRLMTHLGLSEAQIRDRVPEGFEDMPATEWRGAAQGQDWLGFQGYFRTIEEISRFLGLLKRP